MKQGTSGSAQVTIAARPAAVYDVVSDVRRMGEWSPECRECTWIDGATGPVVDARFTGNNRRGFVRWSTKARVVAATPAKEFSFVTAHLGNDMTKWTYRFEPAPNDGDATTVTESFEMLRNMPGYFKVADRLFMGVADRKADLEAGIRETLERLKDAVERS